MLSEASWWKLNWLDTLGGYIYLQPLFANYSLMNTDIRNELNNSDADAPKQLSQ